MEQPKNIKPSSTLSNGEDTKPNYVQRFNLLNKQKKIERHLANQENKCYNNNVHMYAYSAIQYG